MGIFHEYAMPQPAMKNQKCSNFYGKLVKGNYKGVWSKGEEWGAIT